MKFKLKLKSFNLLAAKEAVILKCIKKNPALNIDELSLALGISKTNLSRMRIMKGFGTPKFKVSKSAKKQMAKNRKNN